LFAIATASFVGRGSSFVILSAILAIGVLMALSVQMRSHRVLVLSAAATVCLLMTGYLLWKGTLLSWSVGLATVMGLLALLRFASLNVAHFFLSFLGLQCSLNSLESLRTLYFLSTSSGCRASDAAQMAMLTGLPAAFWAISWTAIAVVVLGFCFLQIFRSR
ncbi:MAG TPA: M50 family metallopeptidase, partial [Acidobacteriota bacterium]